MPNPDKTILFAVRHGETEWNRMGKYQGHLDSPLTEVGIEQAHILAGCLAGQGIQNICRESRLSTTADEAHVIRLERDLPRGRLPVH